ncbi:MAG TPA: metalloregulator ArsR/SmtB family transcription factor, partial [Candidatus Acidoferrales bacterium]|nr:metalloregulator ArsR/SmtB family transcription factor [Candidatus Acidoferrales bacterium]
SVMRTLSDPTRRAIYDRIVHSGEATVRTLTDFAGVSQPAVSQHLKVLHDARLIVGRREGRNTFYRPDPRGLKPLAAWMEDHRRFWEERFDRLGDYLRELQRNEERS